MQFKKEKETPNTVRFQEVPDEDHGDRPMIGTLYVLKKDVKAIGNPEELLITITPVGQ